MTQSPETNGNNGRDNRGRFTNGNKERLGKKHNGGYIRLSDDLRREIDKPSALNPNITWRQHIIQSWLHHAVKGDTGALKEILTRLDGPSGELSGDLRLILERGHRS